MGCSASVKALPNEPAPITHATFDYISVIGEGGFATVRSAVRRKGGDNKILAIKEINLAKVLSTDNKNGIKSILNELHALKAVDYHPFIIKLHYAFRNDTRVYLVFDSLSGGDLRLHLRNGHIFSEVSVAYYVACIGSALNHLHIRNIMHRDVKPENIILDIRGVPYLTDFGISYMGQDNKVALCNMSSGTLAYLAPEVLTPSHRHSFQADFWSLGIIAYELYYKHRPFNPHSPELFIEYTFRVYKNFWKELQTNPMYDYFNKTNLSPELQSTSSSSPENNESIEDDTNLSEEYIIPLPMRTYPITNNNGETNDDIEHENDDDDDDEDGDEDYCHQNLYQPSNELKSLIRGLLDVRIPYRLGSLSNYSQFSNHPSFQRYNYSPTSMDLIKSPIRCFPYKPRKQGSESIFDTDTPDNSEDHESEFNSPASPQLQQQQQQLPPQPSNVGPLAGLNLSVPVRIPNQYPPQQPQYHQQGYPLPPQGYPIQQPGYPPQSYPSYPPLQQQQQQPQQQQYTPLAPSPMGMNNPQLGVRKVIPDATSGFSFLESNAPKKNPDDAFSFVKDAMQKK
mmetsp:Transcript_13422/g.13935  ORF Transcript_13422/g.13935 Transcript_13422/m.13935 type:complete len:567 (-) Transcript_13422:18-1718(-)